MCQYVACCKGKKWHALYKVFWLLMSCDDSKLSLSYIGAASYRLPPRSPFRGCLCKETFSLFLAVHYEVLFQQCHQQYQGEGPTGMLLIYPEHVVHIVEGCWELVEAVIRDCCDSKDRLVFLFPLSLSLFLSLSLPPSIPHSLYLLGNISFSLL